MKLKPSAGLVHELYETISVYGQGAKVCLQIPLLQDKLNVIDVLIPLDWVGGGSLQSSNLCYPSLLSL